MEMEFAVVKEMWNKYQEIISAEILDFVWIEAGSTNDEQKDEIARSKGGTRLQYTGQNR